MPVTSFEFGNEVLKAVQVVLERMDEAESAFKVTVKGLNEVAGTIKVVNVLKGTDTNEVEIPGAVLSAGKDAVKVAGSIEDTIVVEVVDLAEGENEVSRKPTSMAEVVVEIAVKVPGQVTVQTATASAPADTPQDEEDVADDATDLLNVGGVCWDRGGVVAHMPPPASPRPRPDSLFTLAWA